MGTSGGERVRGLLPGFSNSADLGGLPLGIGGSTAYHRVIRADVPASDLTDQRRLAREHTITAVLDLRSPVESQRRPHPLADLDGYRLLPLVDPAAETGRNPAAEPTVGDIYAASLTRNALPIAAIFTALSAAPPGAVMVCCTAGRDRTGMVCALLLDLVGVERAAVVADYTLLGTDSARTLTAAPSQADAASGDRTVSLTREVGSATPSMPSRRGTQDIEVMLAHLESKWGSSRSYLRWLGLDDRSISAIEHRLIPVSG